MIQKITFYCIILGLAVNLFAVRQKIYNLDEMPVVDAHTHLSSQSDFQTAVDKMDQWGGSVCVTLSGTREMENDLDFIKNSLDDRIVVAIRDSDMSDGLWWSLDDIQYFADAGFSGFKVWCQYQQPLSTVSNIDAHLDKMGEAGMPLIALHIGDPPEGQWSVPEKYMIYHQDAEEVIRNHPNTIFIMAHMFWLCCNDTSLDTLAMFFDRNPNLFADMGATFQYFDPPQPSYDKIREFLIKYKDRILFGTDGNSGSSVDQWNNARGMLETDSENAHPFFGSGTMKGLALPLDVLNHIYYWNAAQLIPGVKESLEGLGYEIGDEPPTEEVSVKFDPNGLINLMRFSDAQRTMLVNLNGRLIDSPKLCNGNVCRGTAQSMSPGIYVIYLNQVGKNFIKKTLLFNK